MRMSTLRATALRLRGLYSAELKGPRTLLRIRPGIVDLEPKSAPKPHKAKPKMAGAVPTNPPKPMSIDFGPVSGCFDHNPKLLNCEIAHPSLGWSQESGKSRRG